MIFKTLLNALTDLFEPKILLILFIPVLVGVFSFFGLWSLGMATSLISIENVFLKLLAVATGSAILSFIIIIMMSVIFTFPLIRKSLMKNDEFLLIQNKMNRESASISLWFYLKEGLLLLFLGIPALLGSFLPAIGLFIFLGFQVLSFYRVYVVDSLEGLLTFDEIKKFRTEHRSQYLLACLVLSLLNFIPGALLLTPVLHACFMVRFSWGLWLAKNQLTA